MFVFFLNITPKRYFLYFNVAKFLVLGYFNRSQDDIQSVS